MNPSNLWRLNHPWAAVYSFGIDRAVVARPVARLAFNTDINLLYETIEELGSLSSGTKVLDIPCGSGVAVRGINPGQGLRYMAADISSGMLNRTERAARQRGVEDQVTAVQADVGKMEFADAEFDFCLSLTGLHCFPDPRGAIAELARVTRSGGQLRASWYRTDGGVRHRHGIVIGRASGLVGPSASTAEVERWLTESGFEDVRLTTSGALAYVRAVRGRRGL
jgi:SAM-dependent methyltransferase